MLIKPEYKKYILALSFGNYLKGDGGTDKVIAEHQKIFHSHLYSYVQLAPIGKKTMQSKHTFYTLVIDGKFAGVISECDALNYLNSLSENDYMLGGIFIHHLLKFKMESIYNLCDSTDAPLFFYLHDYYSICTSYKLIDSSGNYCGETKISQEKCGLCDYYKETIILKSRMLDFYCKYSDRITIVSPSRAALEIWKNSYADLNLHMIVVPHQKSEGEYKLKNGNNSIRVAYIGRLIPAKGSQLWEKIVNKLENNSNYELYYFGISDNPYPKVYKKQVFVTPDNPNAMIDALRENKIQIVLLWSVWPETYSYTYYEAMAADSFVITNKKSGNIADAVMTNKNGCVFETEDEALEFIGNYKKTKIALNNYGKKGVLNLDPNNEIVCLVSDTGHLFENKKCRKIRLHIIAKLYNVLYKIKYSREKN